jgi:hypothetical protein
MGLSQGVAAFSGAVSARAHASALQVIEIEPMRRRFVAPLFITA